MARCEDFPCCGHEMGCCPDYDENGRQINMICVCGAKLPVNARYSICAGCMRSSGDDPYDDPYDDPRYDDGYADYCDDEDESRCKDCDEPESICKCDREYE